MAPIAIRDTSSPTPSSFPSAEMAGKHASVPDPEAYGVSWKNGFLPSEPPLQRLPNPYFEPWERLAQRLPAFILSRRIRTEIDRLPILETEKLETEAEWQRACTILGFFTHSYIWAGEVPKEVRLSRRCEQLARTLAYQTSTATTALDHGSVFEGC